MSINYDIIHFEALGEEARHLIDETKAAQECGLIPKDLRYLVIPETIQEFLRRNPGEELPEIISAKTHSVIPASYLSGSKKSIITRSAGYDHIETLAELANITSLRNYCVNSVAQTTMKFVYATAGLLNHYTLNAVTFERNMTSSFMELTSDRIATVFGVGKIWGIFQKFGNRFVMLCGKDFGRRHDGCLKTVIQSDKHAHYGNQCFPASHIAL